MDALALLLALAGRGALGIEVPRADGRKDVFPLAEGIDREAVLRGHLAGELGPVACRRGDGKSWMETRGRAVAASPIADGMAGWCAWDIDAAGPGHVTAQTPEQAHAVALTLVRLLAACALPAFVVASGSAAGRHVWLPLSAPVPAAFATWFADLVRGVAIEKHPGADIEVRPTSTAGTGGNLTLPLRGWAPAVGGGALLLQRVDQVRLCPVDRLAPFQERHAVVLAAEERTRADARRLRMQRAAGRSGDVDSATIDLGDVARSLGEVVAERGGELVVRCPHHQGENALKVRPSKRAWRCFRCEQGGAGDPAAYLLAKFLLGGSPTSAEVFTALRSIHVRP